MKRRPVKITRDLVLFVVGLAGIAHETLISKVADPSLIWLFGGMTLSPAFLNRDEKKGGDEPK